MKILIILTALISIPAYSYSPTLESLLRNGNNGDIEDKTVFATMSITQLDTSTAENEGATNVIKESSIKLLIKNLNESSPELLELIYADSSYSSKTLASFKRYPFNNIHQLERSNERIEKKLFYALMGSLLQNDGTLMLQLLKSLDIPIKYNSELINQNKSSLLYSYRNYLRKVKEGEQDDRNPFKSDDQVTQENINKILSENFLKKDEMIQREKVNNELFWLMRSNDVLMRFNSDHRMKFVRINSTLGSVEATMGKFISFQSGLEFPELILLRDLEGNLYEIKMNSLRLLSDNASSYARRSKKYLEDASDNKINIEAEKPRFLK